MPQRIRNAIGVAEGLLPLLDVSVLLLGFFLILFASGAFSQGQGLPAPTEATLPGIGQVILLRVKAADSMYLSGGSDKGSREIKSLEGLREEFVKAPQTRGKEEPLVLLYYDNPWGSFPRRFDAQVTGIVRAAGCRFARAYP